MSERSPRDRHLIILLTVGAMAFCGCTNEILPPPPPGPPWMTFTRANSQLLDDQINTMALDGEGHVWFGTDSGACAFSSGSWSAIRDSLTYYEHGQSGVIPRRIVTAIAASKDGSIWFGLYGGGIMRFSRTSSARSWQRYIMPDITYNAITCIAAVDNDRGDVWVGTVFGLSRFTPGTMDPTLGTWESTFAPYLPSSIVRSLGVDPITGTVCVGTQQGAVYYDGEHWGIINDPDKTAVISIAFDLTRTVWIGKWDGLTSYSFTSGAMRHFNQDNTDGKLPQGFVNAIALDCYSDTRWFGTYQGLVRLKDTTWTVLRRVNTPALPSDSITALLYDKRNNLWIGTPRGAAVFNETGIHF